MRIYNPLQGEAREWASSRAEPKAEYGEFVQKGKVIKGNSDLARVAGNGQFGFLSRRRKREPVEITKGREGQYMKKRKTLARRRKNVSRLAVSRVLKGVNDLEEAEKAKVARRAKRKRNRNKKARQGRKR